MDIHWLLHCTLDTAPDVLAPDQIVSAHTLFLLVTQWATTSAFILIYLFILIPPKNGFEVVPHIELDCNAGGPIVLVIDMS